MKLDEETYCHFSFQPGIVKEKCVLSVSSEFSGDRYHALYFRTGAVLRKHPSSNLLVTFGEKIAKINFIFPVQVSVFLFFFNGALNLLIGLWFLLATFMIRNTEQGCCEITR